MNSVTEPPAGGTKILRGASARAAAALFNYGNIVGILIPVPLGMLWLGISMIVYAMNRHHPNPKVGHYTQQAAYRFYGVTGAFTAVAIFFPGQDWTPYLGAWILGALVLIPWSILDIVRIHRDEWEDMEIPEGHP